jgi:hypothetical protein
MRHAGRARRASRGRHPGVRIAHEKELILDRRVTIMGSYNFSAAAARNSEDLNVVTSPEVAAAYAAHWQARHRRASQWCVDRRSTNPVTKVTVASNDGSAELTLFPPAERINRVSNYNIPALSSSFLISPSNSDILVLKRRWIIPPKSLNIVVPSLSNSIIADRSSLPQNQPSS